MCENDLFFDIKTGESIIKYGFDFKDHFSWIDNLTYIYLHWLYDIIIYCIYTLFKFKGLFVFFLFIFYIFSIIFYNIIYKYCKNSIFSVIITLFIIIFCNYAFVTRVQSIIFLLLLVQLTIMEKMYKTCKLKYFMIELFLSILIVNLQMPIWIFSIILYLPYLFEIFLFMFKERITKYINIKLEPPKNIKLFFTYFFLIFISGVLSPLNIYSYIYCIKSLNDPIYSIIGLNEMQMTRLFANKYVLILHLLLIVFQYLKIIKLSIRDFCLFIGLFVFSLIVNKNVAFYIIFGTYLFAKNLDYTFINIKIKDYCNRINISFINILMILYLLPFSFFWVEKKLNDFNDYGIEYYPVGIANYIISNLDYKNLKIFTEFNNGSYLLFRNIPVFVDSRAEVYIGKYNGGKEILKDYNNLSKISTYKDVLEKYSFDYMIISRGTTLYELISMDKMYFNIYNYNEYSLFKKVSYVVNYNEILYCENIFN